MVETLIGIEEPKDKVKAKTNPVQYYVKFSFVITYILLLTTGTITFIEAMRTKIPQVRHVLNLETAISVIAGYFYSVFVEQIDKFNAESKEIAWEDITKTRYIDWSITTPLMLLVLCVVLGMNSGIAVKFPVIVTVILLNYFMLYFGYLGETGTWSRFNAMIAGFGAFFAMFAIIFMNFVQPRYVRSNYILYGIYIVLWSLYGVVYIFNEEYKNITTNILDCTAKCFVGLGIWAYYTKIIV